MNRYFTSRAGAIRRLVNLRRELGEERLPELIVGRRNNGVEVHGLDQVLLDLRAGRLQCFTCGGQSGDDVVFVS